jgi:hypothetical protein
MAIKIAPPKRDLPIAPKLGGARPFWRLFGWGGAATMALAAAALASQTDTGSKRLQLALGLNNEPVQAVAQIPPRAAETDAETRYLAAQLSELAADRERLNKRIAMLERNLEDMTGSIQRQSEDQKIKHAAGDPAAQINTQPRLNTQPPVASSPATVAIAALEQPPVPSALAIARPVVALAPKAAPIVPPTTPPVVAVPMPPARALPSLAPLAMPAVRETAASWPPAKPKAAEGAAELPHLQPVRVAAAPASEAAAEAPSARSEIGIDLGGAATIEALRAHWVALKANYGPLLEGLEPLVAQYPKHPSGITYRLVAGPLPSATEAARFCTRFPAKRTGCHPAKFSGAQLALH